MVVAGSMHKSILDIIKCYNVSIRMGMAMYCAYSDRVMGTSNGCVVGYSPNQRTRFYCRNISENVSLAVVLLREAKKEEER